MVDKVGGATVIRWKGAIAYQPARERDTQCNQNEGRGYFAGSVGLGGTVEPMLKLVVVVGELAAVSSSLEHG